MIYTALKKFEKALYFYEVVCSPTVSTLQFWFISLSVSKMSIIQLPSVEYK